MKKNKYIQLLQDKGYTPLSNLNYETGDGIEFYIGTKENAAMVIALMHDQNIYMIGKQELREMSWSAKIEGVEKVHLITNYGLELHSEHEKPGLVGFDSIEKISVEDLAEIEEDDDDIQDEDPSDLCEECLVPNRNCQCELTQNK